MCRKKEKMGFLSSVRYHFKVTKILQKYGIPCQQLKDRNGWAMQCKQQNGTAFHKWTFLAQNLPADCKEQVLMVQRYVT